MSFRSAARRLVRSAYLWVAAAFVVAVVVAFVILRVVTTGNFDRLERENVSGQADRVSSSLGYEASLIGSFVNNNAEWDDAYRAIVRRDAAAAAVAFPPQQARAGFDFGAVVLLDRAGVVVGGGMVTRDASYAPVSRSLASRLAMPPVLGSKAGCGVLAAVEAHYLYCAAPVVHSDGSGPAVGTLVVLRTLDDAGIAAIGRRAGLQMRPADIPLGGHATTLVSALGALTVSTRVVSAGRLDLLVGVPAVEGGAALVLEVAFARPVHAAANQSAVTSAEIVSVLGIALLAISILAQRMARGRRNHAFVQAVRTASASGGRVTPPTRELAVLASSANELLDAITARQLEAQHASEAIAAAAAAELASEARAQQAAAYAAGQAEIAELGRLALSGAPLEELYDCAVGAAWRVLSSDCAWLLKCSPDSSGPVLLAEVGWPDQKKGEPIADEGRLMSGYAVGSQIPVVVQDWEQELPYVPSGKRLTRGVRSSVGVLVGDPDSPFGLLEVQYTQSHAVPTDSAPFLAALARVLDEAIRSTRAQDTIRSQSRSLETMTDSLRDLVDEKERLIEQIPGVVMVFDGYPDGSRTYVFVSRQSRTLLGVEPSAFHDDPLWFIGQVHPEDRELLRAAVRQPAALGLDPLPVVFRFERADGQQVWLRAAATLVHSDERSHRVQVVLFDMTDAKQAELERERLEQDLRLAQKLEAVGQLAAGVAHEINTPVQFIGNSVTFLKRAADKLLSLTNVYYELLHTDEPIDKEERQRRAVAAEEDADLEYLTERIPPAIGRALDGIERVSEIVRAMRQFAHPSTERTPIDVNEGVRTTLIVARNEYKYVADIELDLGELPLVMASGGDLNQVVLNLIVNASHAIEARVRDTDQRGTITVRTRADDAGVLLTVSDTGCGIPAEIARRVFDPFFTTKPVGRGTGQGLALAHAIVVERHHGAINFEPNPGGGTTFRVLLPLDLELDDYAGDGAAVETAA
jgi:signal transduction histidine kinase/sensor domain CHASE-containing protein